MAVGVRLGVGCSHPEAETCGGQPCIDLGEEGRRREERPCVFFPATLLFRFTKKYPRAKRAHFGGGWGVKRRDKKKKKGINTEHCFYSFVIILSACPQNNFLIFLHLNKGGQEDY